MTSQLIARALVFDAKVVNSKKMKPLPETSEAKTKRICEKLAGRSLDKDDRTRMKLPTSLGGMGIKAVISQLETSLSRSRKRGKN